MGRYFFDVIHDGRLCADEEGVDCADDRRARLEASRFLAELAARIISAEHGGQTAIEIRDARHRIIASVGFAVDIGTRDA